MTLSDLGLTSKSTIFPPKVTAAFWRAARIASTSGGGRSAGTAIAAEKRIFMVLESATIFMVEKRECLVVLKKQRQQA